MIRKILRKIEAIAWHYPHMRRYYQKVQAELQNKQSGSIVPDALPAVVFSCDGLTQQGGLADRLRGLVSLYSDCKATGRSFKINFTTPFALSDFLVPNFYDWRIDPAQISYHPTQSPVVFTVPPKAGDSWFDASFLVNYWHSQMHDPSRQYRIYTNVDSVGAEFGALYKELFQPSAVLQQAIDEQLAEIGGSYVSVSFRFLDILGDFKDNIQYHLSDERTQEILTACLHSIETIAARHPGLDRILVTSDSQRFLGQAQKYPKVYIVPGEIAHVDFSDASHLKTFLDFYLISTAQKVYLARTPEMYPSSYARTAALINATPFEQLLLP